MIFTPDARRPESVTILMMSGGVIASALRSAEYPPVAMYSSYQTTCRLLASCGMRLVRTGSLKALFCSTGVSPVFPGTGKMPVLFFRFDGFVDDRSPKPHIWVSRIGCFFHTRIFVQHLRRSIRQCRLLDIRSDCFAHVPDLPAEPAEKASAGLH